MKKIKENLDVILFGGMIIITVVALLLTALFTLLKLLTVIKWSWFYVLVPTLSIMALLWIGAFAIMGFVVLKHIGGNIFNP